MLENNKIISANNQENSSYPSGLCAERVAIFYASANYPNKLIKMIALTAQNNKNVVAPFLSPCGSCRQVIAEYEFKQNIN